ncbi:MAG: radical SAM protein [Candidatus Omnitrophota bacterium]|nr:radical SAM protein [Candidatus Omnitrophota bacterium]MBU1929403.1 radical SAM protein [Candidatus Omnitrophota bacterium]MBU2034278.1 radical SAM protein [Candidatus Omnitrophota bacterium]
MKVLVINEPFVKDFCRTQRWAARSRGRVLRAPDWLAYAAAVLEKDGHNVRLLDMVADGMSKIDLRRIIKKEQPDFVVLDSTTPSIYSDIECAGIVKSESGAGVIMVGPHISSLPEETLLYASGTVDVACIGEYDYTVSESISRYNNLESVKGIVYYNNGSLVRNEARDLIDNLDELPFPAWRHLDLMKYFDGGKLYPYIDIISGRGCPNSCVFCLWPQVMHGLKYRFRSPGNVVDEIEYDIRLCPRVLRGGEFFFEDDTFTVNKERSVMICEEIMRRNLKITFSVNARVDSADLGMFKVMKKAGCRELLVGFESGSQVILDNAHKNITLENSYKFMELARSAGLCVHGCFVIGLPGETEETAQETVDFAMSLKCDTLQFSGAVPFPGTKFFEMAKDNCWLKTRDWSRWLGEGEQKGIVEYPGIVQERINYYVDLGLRKFYLRPVFIIKFILSTRSLSDLYRKLRGGVNYFNYLLSIMLRGRRL